jgi:hypothetical protein
MISLPYLNLIIEMSIFYILVLSLEMIFYFKYKKFKNIYKGISKIVRITYFLCKFKLVIIRFFLLLFTINNIIFPKIYSM